MNDSIAERINLQNSFLRFLLLLNLGVIAFIVPSYLDTSKIVCQSGYVNNASSLYMFLNYVLNGPLLVSSIAILFSLFLDFVPLEFSKSLGKFSGSKYLREFSSDIEFTKIKNNNNLTQQHYFMISTIKRYVIKANILFYSTGLMLGYMFINLITYWFRQ